VTNKTSLNTTTGGFHLKAKKSLGQNFLSDDKIIQQIVSFVDNLCEHNNRFVHEIGPGSGALTLPMLERGMKITAIEKDLRAYEGLVKATQSNPDFEKNFHIIESDILKWDPKDFVDSSQKPICVGNIPYYITSDILMWFCKHKNHYSHGIFMVQDEVADRLNAKKRTKDYGRLTVKMQLNFEIKKLLFVPAASFVPKPKVNSAVILLTPNDFSFSSEHEEKSFERFTVTLFSARRKMLRRALAQRLDQLKEKKGEGAVAEFWKLANEIDVFEDTRPDAIGPVEILKLHRFFVSQST
jgi:16S rRNA (adenine1518-N6/adenine1519-N6)-dimethyltransferase